MKKINYTKLYELEAITNNADFSDLGNIAEYITRLKNEGGSDGHSDLQIWESSPLSFEEKVDMFESDVKNYGEEKYIEDYNLEKEDIFEDDL